MPKTPPSDFAILIDSSCLTDSTDLKMPTKRNDSDQTVIHHEIEDEDGSTTDRLRRELEDHSDNEGSAMDSQLSSNISSNISTDSHTEALIQAAARAVVASMEQEAYEDEQEDSLLSSRTEEGYEGGTELTFEDGSALTYGDGSDAGDEEDVEDSDHSAHDRDLYDGSASSHHEDDVFSQGNRHSNRSSLNSCVEEELEGQQEENDEKEETNEDKHSEREEHNSPLSRAPSHTSTTFSLLPEPLAITGSPKPHTPSKVLSRPPFRTPSSVRALQMTSPTPSLFSSPRSNKRPTVSRLGTPHAHSPSKTKTPTRFKAKKEYPLVLLHVTVLPLRWPYADAMDAMNGEGLPRELHGVRESWKLLKEKLGDTVLERGILLPHPQDSYEILEERLLEALELPVRPRAKILSCGHYMGPDEAGMSSGSDSENDDDVFRVSGNEKEKWCDICLREVRFEEFGIGGKQKRFRVKVYASNGLMGAGAWEAAWREMERVDVEIEPFVQSHLVPLMDSLAASHLTPAPADVFVAEPVDAHVAEEAEMRRQEMEEERMREVYGSESRPASKMGARPSKRHESKHSQYGDSLPDLMLAAFKVAMRDRKNVAIFALSILVLLLALRPGSSSGHIGDASFHHAIMDNDISEVVEVGVQAAAEIPAQVMATVNSVTEAVKPVMSPEPSATMTPEEEKIEVITTDTKDISEDEIPNVA